MFAIVDRLQLVRPQSRQRLTTTGLGRSGWRQRDGLAGRRQQPLAIACDLPQPDNDEDVQRTDDEDGQDAVEETLAQIQRREGVLVVLQHGTFVVRLGVVSHPQQVVRSY